MGFLYGRAGCFITTKNGGFRPGAVVECENLTVVSGDWEPLEWARSDNYFAATLADTFLSRRAYLRAPAHAGRESVAAASMLIGAADNYHVLLRFEVALDVKVVLAPPCVFH
jgi:hypothetical protein